MATEVTISNHVAVDNSGKEVTTTEMFCDTENKRRNSTDLNLEGSFKQT